MSRFAYVNGRYLPHHRAMVSIDDRGYQFADGVYEVIAIKHGRMADGDAHFDRLAYSLEEMEIPFPMSRRALEIIINNTARLNRVSEGMVYCQITRGVMRRDHAYGAGLTPQIVITAKRMRVPDAADDVAEAGRAITVTDIRWHRRDIKSIQLLPNCMAKTHAVREGGYEAVLVEEGGVITEGASSNIWIVTHDGELITRPLSNDILAGVTRKTVLELAAARNLKITERAFTLDEALAAAEVFMTNTTSLVKPLGMIDDTVIGDGEPGPVTLALRRAYLEHIGGAG